jgi:hypothetical protein
MIGLPPTVQENPLIPFVSKAKKVENLDEAVNKKTEHIKLELYSWIPATLLLSIPDTS